MSDNECAHIAPEGGSIVLTLVLFLVGVTEKQTVVGYTLATIALTSYVDIADLISISSHTDDHIRMQKHDSNCTSQTNSVDLVGSPCLVFDPELLNAFENIDAVIKATSEEDPCEASFLAQ